MNQLERTKPPTKIGWIWLEKRPPPSEGTPVAGPRAPRRTELLRQPSHQNMPDLSELGATRRAAAQTGWNLGNGDVYGMNGA